MSKNIPQWKKERKEELQAKFFVYCVLVPMIIVGAILFVKGIDRVFSEEILTESTENKETETITVIETEFEEEITTPTEISLGIEEYKGDWFVFCVVTEIREDTFVVEMPWGDLEEFYMMQDPPIDDFGNPYFTTVVFRVPKELWTDFSKYEVISVV